VIQLSDIWPIEEPEQYKLHFARWNRINRPLEVWVRDKREWQGWQEYRKDTNFFNRPFIFTLIQFYHEPDVWLFGGVFRVLERHPDRYEVELTTQGEGFLGRLKLKSTYRERATRVNFENHFPNLELQEILREPYGGRDFPGFESIDLSFEELEALVRNSRQDWQGALSKVKGIYLITDTVTNKRYVGAAYGDQGIWGRWSQYVETGHGDNIELRTLVKAQGCFALLEARQELTTDSKIIDRETFWKEVLLTRGKQGLNRN